LKQGEKISNLENASQNLTHLFFDYFQKNFENNLQKICKNKTCGASVVQNGENEKEINPCASYENIIVSFQATFALTIMQTSSIMHFYICFGLCWHQSPKRGRLKGK
jgi:hypothetical protein